MPMAESAHWRRAAPLLLGVAALSAVIATVLHIGELERFGELARGAVPSWLLLACLAQAGTYLCLASIWTTVLERAGYSVKLGSLMRLAVAKHFADQALPTGGISGLLLVLGGLRRRGFSEGAAAATLVVGILSFYGAYLLLAILTLGMLWWHGHLGAGAELAALGLALFAATIIGLVLLFRRWSHAGAPRWVSRFAAARLLLGAQAAAPAGLLRDPSLLVRAAALQSAIFLLDALTLWLCFAALGAGPSPWIALAGFCMASIAATLGPIPLGLGTFEAGAIATLHLLGEPVETALAATLLFRGLSFWVPMLPGLWLARRELPRPAA